jgi:hypothetical protein
MSDPLKPEPKPDDLTQTTKPESIELDEKEADEISAGSCTGCGGNPHRGHP